MAKKTPAPPPTRQMSATRGNNDKGTYSWLDLQEQLRDCKTSKQVEEYLKAELRGPARLRWMLRIHGRRCLLRNIEEITVLESKAKE